MKAFLRTFREILSTVSYIRLLSGWTFMCIISISILVCPSQAFQRIKTNEMYLKTKIDSDAESLEALTQAYSRSYHKKKKLALEQAIRKGWTIRKHLDSSNVIELQEIDPTGHPVYYISINIDAADTISADELWPGGSLNLNLSGNGMKIGVWETGAVRTSHQEFGGRATQIDGATDYDEHATHVAGTLAASGVDPKAKGMAYEADLDAYEWNNDQAEMALAASNGLLISNHSYGTLSGWYHGNYQGNGAGWYWFGNTRIDPDEDFKFGFYNTGVRKWDEIAFSYPHYLIVKGAGNDRDDGMPSAGASYYILDPVSGTWTRSTEPRDADGGKEGYDTIDSYGNAKNVLTVGAVDDIHNGYSYLSDAVMSGFSSWGPTDDGRIKPDICANGVNIYSADRSGDAAYKVMSGTSMAAPNAAGALLLLQQHHQNIDSGNAMLSSTLKALAIHTADEAGPDPGPDYMFGWGVMNAEKAADLISRKYSDVLIQENRLYNDAAYTMDVSANGTEPLVATIVWTDPAGTPVSPISIDPPDAMLVNDLDMRIIDNNSVEYAPWVLNPDAPASAAATGDNFRDNVEQIRIDNPDAAVYSIEITHKGALKDGAPQHFSLIVSGIDGFNTDIAVKNVTAKASECEYNNSTPVAIFVKNVGKQDLGNIEVDYEVRTPEDALVSSGTESISSLRSGEESSIEVTVDLSKTAYVLYANAVLPTDQNLANNFYQRTFYTNSAYLASSGSNYFQGFEGISDLNEIGWTIEDSNQDNFTWATEDYSGSGDPYSGSNLAYCRFHPSQPADDWLFSNCLFLKAGEQYRVSFYFAPHYYTPYNNKPQKMMLKLGKAASSSAMTTLVHDYGDIIQKEFQLSTQNFSVPSDGIYYLGWHAYSDANPFILRIDDVTIENASISITAPDIQTEMLIPIAPTSLLIKTQILYHGTETVTARGVCWNTSENPEIGDFKTKQGSDSGQYLSRIDSLNPGIQYFFRPYATITLPSGTSETFYGQQHTVTQPADFNAVPGNVQVDEAIDLKDIILALRIIAGIDVSPNQISLQTDADGNHQITIAEVMYIFRILSFIDSLD